MTHAKTADFHDKPITETAGALSALQKKAPTLMELFWVFVVASLVGLVAEVIVSYFNDGRWESRAGLVWGPFSPIYGVGAVLMTAFLWPLKHRPLALFASAALLGGAFEYVAGWFWESYYGIVAWSYADQPFNIGGHTCLSIALVWGLAGVLWFKWGYPAIQEGVASVPPRPRRIITGLMVAFMAVDIALTFAALGCWFDRQAGLPIETPLQQFCATYFGDTFMSTRFETMSMWTSLALNR